MNRAAEQDHVLGIPKAEIHLHLEGSVRLPTLRRIAGRLASADDPESKDAGLAALYTHRDFQDFLQNFRRVCGSIRSPEDFAAIADDLSSDLQRQNVRYAEVFCSPIIFRKSRGLPAAEIMDAVSASARRRERLGGPRLRFLLDGVRQFGLEGMEEVVAAASDCRRFDVIGVGMGGDERAAPTAAFEAPYREARRLGLRTTVHAGEFDGARSVWDAIDVLQVERVGHGVRAAEDPELVRVLAARGIPLECCPTSNIATGTVSAWDRHPIRALHRAGVAVTVNSDDPAMFSTTLVDEWDRLVTRCGLDRREALEIGARTARATFLPAAEKEDLVSAILSSRRQPDARA